MEVRRIVFNGGDRLFASGASVIRYRDSPEVWPAFFSAQLQEWRPDAVLLFGDERPIHRVAREVARARQVPVWCFEEGYIRPNYVTCELYGNNANSPLPRTPDALQRTAPPSPAAPPLRSQFSAMALSATAYYLAAVLKRRHYPFYLHHRDRSLTSEARYWTRSFARKVLATPIDRKAIRRLTGTSRPEFFLVALQVHDDLQLLRHGRGWSVKSFIIQTLASFAAHAHPTHQLVFKVHPLDRGHTHYAKLVHRHAERYGVTDRVQVLQSGVLGPLVRASKGLVTINSTSGVAAITAGVPVLVMGNTFYRVEGLACIGSTIEDINRFWRTPTPPDPEIAQAFLRHLVGSSLLPGSFYDRATWPSLADAVFQRISPLLRVLSPVGRSPTLDRSASPVRRGGVPV
ncbi:DUF6716 putative glycosyltransferase [Microvirga sp. TS319]|uniref:capsular polysaccharide export protein, LipB/KpsS family n=1 Tax=Microvirga sp. TS319 TaxID=3241165 RepID=UPI00351A10C8